jgi:hypothetical protein
VTCQHLFQHSAQNRHADGWHSKAGPQNAALPLAIAGVVCTLPPLLVLLVLLQGTRL